MFYKVKSVQPLPDFILLVDFQNGEQKQYNVKPLFDKWEPFKVLTTTAGLFEQVKVDTGGFGISWNDEIDLSCNELYYNGGSAKRDEYTPEDIQAISEARERIARGDSVSFASTEDLATHFKA